MLIDASFVRLIVERVSINLTCDFFLSGYSDIVAMSAFSAQELAQVTGGL